MPDEIAIAALVGDGSLLLAHRHPARRWYPDCWDLVGGHVEHGESPTDAVCASAARRLRSKSRNYGRWRSGSTIRVFALTRSW